MHDRCWDPNLPTFKDEEVNLLEIVMIIIFIIACAIMLKVVINGISDVIAHEKNKRGKK